tara:strand:- start:484 stop:705 length:222 start_codon:yes stop_codon:yes gene_type:complete
MAEDKDSSTEEKTKLPFWKTLLSVMQASFGVQSRANKERDFANGSVKGFVVAALIFTALFIATLVIVVRSVLP